MITKLSNKEKMIASIIFMLEHKTTVKQKRLLRIRGFLNVYSPRELPEGSEEFKINMDIFDGKGCKELNEMYMDLMREFASNWIEYDNSTENISVDENGVAWVRQ